MTPSYWRQRADEARAVADQFHDPDHRRKMLSIADSYEQLAQSAERVERSRALLASIRSGRKRT